VEERTDVAGGPVEDVPRPIRAAIFDVDGVLVDSPHERAWRESLRELMEHDWRALRARTTWTPEAFTPHLYRKEVSGKPRAAGARALLEHFALPADDAHVAAYARRKDALVTQLIEDRHFAVYPDALRFLLDVKDLGLAVAAASSSKNAGRLMARIEMAGFAREHRIGRPPMRPAATLLDLIDVDVSGRDFARGKPDPDMFLAALGELRVPASDAIVIEDALAGVQAAKAGRMRAIGIARADDAHVLAAAGADLVVTSLDDVDTPALAVGRVTARQGDGSA
jgi:beta-phosphoglucomutase-like phosphatase (HAD superfamily)